MKAAILRLIALIVSIDKDFARGGLGLVGLGVLVAVVAGCATSAPRSSYQQEIQPSRLTNVVAYRSGTNLQLRIPYPGADSYAHAHWDRPDTNVDDFQTRFALLAFDKQAPSSRRNIQARTNRLSIRSAQQWKQLVQTVFARLAPTQAGHGVLFVVQSEEIVAYRDAKGQVNAVRLESKPSDVLIDKTYRDADFTRAAIRLLRLSAGDLAPKENQFLFTTGADPAFVFMDLQQGLVVFLSFPQDPESPGLTGGFTVRALDSLLFRSLIVTAVKNPFTLVGRALWHLGASGARAVQTTPTPPSVIPPLGTNAPMDLARWEKELDHLVTAKRYPGKLDLYVDGGQFFPALIESVQSAKHSVDAQVFIFDTDAYAVQIAQVLKDRSTNAKVRVLMDDAGSLFAGSWVAHAGSSKKRPEDITAFLMANSKVRVRVTANPWLTLDHRKLFIFDNRQAYLGGMNIGQDYRYGWHDMMVGVTGPVVGQLSKQFDEAWAHAGPFGDFAYAWEALFKRASARRNTITNSIDIRPLRTATGKTQIYRAQLEAIEHAQNYIYIENPYFTDDSMLRALARARERGVDVRVIFPKDNDSAVMQTSDQMVGNILLACGARVYVYPGMTHVKAAIYDGWACVGSANFSKMSLLVGQELDVGFSDPATVGKLKAQLFEVDFNKSLELKKPVPMDWVDPFVRAFGSQL